MNHPHQRSALPGVVLAVIGVLLVLVLGSVIIVGGVAWRYAQQAQLAEKEAMMLARRERMLAEDAAQATAAAKRAAEYEREVARHRLAMAQAQSDRGQPPSVSAEVLLKRDGQLSFDGEALDLAQFRDKLSKAAQGGSQLVIARPDPDCPARHLLALQAVCEEVPGVVFRLGAQRSTGE